MLQKENLALLGRATGMMEGCNIRVIIPYYQALLEIYPGKI